MIEINNLTTNPVNEEFLKKVGKIVLEGEHPSIGRVPENLDLSVALVGPAKIRKLNKTYLKKNRATDVLAFGQTSRYKIKDVRYKIQDLGEIVICLKEVKKNAKGFGVVFEKELARVLIHGVLHLLGEDHEISEKRAKEMEIKQEYYLSQIGEIGEGSGEPFGCRVATRRKKKRESSSPLPSRKILKTEGDQRDKSLFSPHCDSVFKERC